MISVESLIAAGVPPTQARMFVVPLRMACAEFAIDTPARVAGFIAQCRVESSDFAVLEENLRYRTPERLLQVFPSRVRSHDDAARLIAAGPKAIASRVYANKNGNGDEASGDGWAYRGRGLIQLTGRSNYHDAGIELGQPYVDYPDLVLDPTHACLTAGWFWHVAKCNVLADSAQWDAITRAINGPARLHADLRRQYAEEAVGVFA